MTLDPLTGLDPNFTFDTYLHDDRDIALAAASGVAEHFTDGRGGRYDLLFLYAPAGMGKTHLLHAIGNRIATCFPGTRVRLVHAVDVCVEAVSASQHTGLPAFRDAYTSECDVLLVDEVDVFGDRGPDGSQEEFARILQTRRVRGLLTVLSVRRYPKDIAGLIEPIKRLVDEGFVANIQPPSLPMKLAMLRQWSEGVVEIPDDVAATLTRSCASPGELFAAFGRIRDESVRTGMSVTMEIFGSDPRLYEPDAPDAGEIMAGVARFFDLSTDHLKGPCRARVYVVPRQIAMWLIRKYTRLSLPAIGQIFGDRDHTTVIHAVRKVEAMLLSDPAFRVRIEEIIRELELPINLNRLSA